MKNRINLSKYHLRTDLIIDDAKGKPRRIKGKKIKLTEFTHEAVECNRKIIVHVKSWEFVK